MRRSMLLITMVLATGTSAFALSMAVEPVPYNEWAGENDGVIPGEAVLEVIAPTEPFDLASTTLLTEPGAPVLPPALYDAGETKILRGVDSLRVAAGKVNALNQASAPIELDPERRQDADGLAYVQMKTAPTQIVPEPMTIVLIALGAGGLAVNHLRRGRG
jgi:hypothetical protein